MITDNYSKMVSNMKDMSMYRSGSAPPTVEGSLNAVGGLFGGGVTEEELRSDPAYIEYYYSNVNLNPRLPPPLVAKEDWRVFQGMHGGGSGGGGGVAGEDGGSTVSLFSMDPRIEWGGGEGLNGLPGLGLGVRRQKSIGGGIMQNDINHAKSVSGQPSRPASYNAFGDSIESSESHFAHIHHEYPSMDALCSGANIRGTSPVQNTVSSASHTYASALSASLSRNHTPDPQLLTRAPSPCIPPVGGGRSSSMDKRSVNGPNSFNDVSPVSEPTDLVSALSDMTLSPNSKVDEDTRLQFQSQHGLNDHKNLFHLQDDQNTIRQHSYLNKSSAKVSFPSLGKSSGVGLDMSNSTLVAGGRVGLHKPSAPSENSYLKGPSTTTLISRGSSPSCYQNVDSPNSLLSKYDLSCYGINPQSPSTLGNRLGSGNFPPLFESVAAATAMGASGMDSRAMRGGLTLGHNFLASAAELQNLSRVRHNHPGSALQVPVMDPLHLQYLKSARYPMIDRGEPLGNSYMDLLGIQKAYLGEMLSSRKSQYSLQYHGKSGSLNHGFYGSPSLGLGMSYNGSQVAGPLLPNCHFGSGSPVRHGERSMCFPSGARSLAGGIVGSWQSEGGGNLDEILASSLMYEFKNNKTKYFELAEIAGYVVEFSADQYGSRFIQQKLETATTEDKNMVFHEIMPRALCLMTDVFGNYVIQKFFEHGSASQIRELADQLTGHVLTLSLQMYGCRVIQKAVEVVDLDQQTKMAAELAGHVMRCVRDQNGNHVIQKCIECIPEEAIQPIISTLYDQIVTLSTHPYGCRVIQRVLEHCKDPKTQQIMMEEIMKSVWVLALDQYGNYVVQHVLQQGKPHERTAIMNQFIGQIVQMSQQKFSSNVVEKCLTYGTPQERQTLVNEMLGSTDENDSLQAMMKDQFGNYVVQKVLETCDDLQLELVLNRIKVHLNVLKRYTYGKHIVARVEKLVAAGERRIGNISSYSADAA